MRQKFSLIARPGRGLVPPRAPRRMRRLESRGKRADTTLVRTSSRTSSQRKPILNSLDNADSQRGQRRKGARKVRASESAAWDNPFKLAGKTGEFR